MPLTLLHPGSCQQREVLFARLQRACHPVHWCTVLECRREGSAGQAYRAHQHLTLTSQLRWRSLLAGGIRHKGRQQRLASHQLPRRGRGAERGRQEQGSVRVLPAPGAHCACAEPPSGAALLLLCRCGHIHASLLDQGLYEALKTALYGVPLPDTITSGLTCTCILFKAYMAPLPPARRAGFRAGMSCR